MHIARSTAVMRLLRPLSREHQAAVIVVTHDERMPGVFHLRLACAPDGVPRPACGGAVAARTSRP